MIGIDRDSLENLSTDNFKPEKFVKDLSCQCIGAEELRKRRVSIQDLADYTSARLKRNVYQNYTQFIGTSREISYLESEMYQLSQLLGEQQSLLNEMVIQYDLDPVVEIGAEVALVHTSEVSSIQESKQKLSRLMENVEGASILTDNADRICLHEGPLLELDSLEGTALKKVHAYLLNDLLVIATCSSSDNERGPSKYRLQVVYDIRSLAFVNVKDLGRVKQAFKLLASPDSRIFQCSSASSKKEWLDKFDQVKKLDDRVKESIREVNRQRTEDVTERIGKPCPELDTIGSSGSSKSIIGSHHLFLDIIPEMEENLDSYLAQRDHIEAYRTLKQMRYHLLDAQDDCDGDPGTCLNEKASELISSIMKQFELSTEAKSLQVDDLGRVKKITKLLICLDCSAQACELFLRLCSEALKTRVARVKRDGAILPYMRFLSAVSFNSIIGMCDEFLRTFPLTVNCTSALIMWSNFELQKLISHMSKQMFIPQVSWSILIECINTVHHYSDQMIHIGLDVRPDLSECFGTQLIKILKDTGEKYSDYSQTRAAEEDWKPTTLENSHSLAKLNSEFDSLQLTIPSPYMREPYRISLTCNTLAFSKAFMGFVRDCLVIITPQTFGAIESALSLVLAGQVGHLKSALRDPQLQKEAGLIQENIEYIKDVVVRRSLDLFERSTSSQPSKLMRLRDELQATDVSMRSRHKRFARGSISKYSTTEYV